MKNLQKQIPVRLVLNYLPWGSFIPKPTIFLGIAILGRLIPLNHLGQLLKAVKIVFMGL